MFCRRSHMLDAVDRTSPLGGAFDPPKPKRNIDKPVITIDGDGRPGVGDRLEEHQRNVAVEQGVPAIAAFSASESDPTRATSGSGAQRTTLVARRKRVHRWSTFPTAGLHHERFHPDPSRVNPTQAGLQGGHAPPRTRASDRRAAASRGAQSRHRDRRDRAAGEARQRLVLPQ